jgi:hypothetical protein
VEAPADSTGLSSPNPALAPGEHWTFGLSSLFLFVTLVAVICGVFALHPGLGIALAAAAAPAFLRTSVVAARLRASGKPLGTFESIAEFLGSVGIVCAIALATATAFFATCVPLAAIRLHAGSTLCMFGSFILAVTAAIAAFWFTTRRLWPRKD